MNSFLVAILALYSFLLQAQQEVNILADISYSDCDETGFIRPRIQNEVKTSDTTLVHIYGSANCAGILDASAHVRNDSVFVSLKEGRIEISKRILYVVNGEELGKSEFNKLFAKDSSIVYDTIHKKREVVSKTNCNCCFHFYFKLIDLDPECNYTYILQGKEVITEIQYTLPEELNPGPRFPYFFHQSDSIIELGLFETYQKNKGADSITSAKQSYFFDIKVDTQTGEILSVQRSEWSNTRSSMDVYFIEYIKSLSPIMLQRDPYKNKIESRYLIKFGFDKERTRVYMGVGQGE